MPKNIPQKILVVDDENANIRLLVEILSSYPYEILGARSGQEAIRIAKASTIDLVILDIMMPGMDGYQTCQQLKKIPHIAETPIIFLSALTDPKSIVKGFSLGGVDYISKPFYEEEVISRINTHLTLSKTRKNLQIALLDLLKSEASLKNLQVQMETVLDSIDSVIYVADLKSHDVLYANNKCTQIVGECAGKKCYEVMQQGQNSPCPFCSNSFLLDLDGKPTGVYTWEFQNILNNRWYLCQDIAIPWIDGRYVRLEIATDLTEKKLQELALRQANAKLNLLSSITRHDILNQLMVLTNLLELQQDLIMDPELRKLTILEMEASLKISHLIQFTKEYEDVGVKNPIWMNLYDCIVLLPSLPHTVTLNIEEDTKSFEIFGDPMISKVFYNLVDNAIRHGGIINKISFLVTENYDSLIIACEDDGVGIDPEMRELIFNRGYGKNSGLGLFFCHEILSISSIIIQETGKPGKGARFELIVPKQSWRRVSSD